jgi:predicted phosphodiesterase
MKTLIISDIHANITALKAVLEDAAPFDRVWCLGDVVGYGPDPNACIERIRDLPQLVCIKGNHDAAILGEIDASAFNQEARQSLHWLESNLDDSNRRWLAKLDEHMVVDGVTLAHGSPRNPVWEYIMDLETARENMRAFDTRVCLVGHTHIPCVYRMEGDHPETTELHFPEPGMTFSLNQKSIVNPGSVGQPRDHNPRASYLLFDDGEWTYHRVDYDIDRVQQRILSAGLPRRHAYRLGEGW